MPQTQTRENAASLETLAAAHFKRAFTNAEQNLLKNVTRGELVDRSVPIDFTDPANDPSKANEWGPDREITAELISWLCVDSEAKERADPGGIRIQGAKITGKLNLDFAVVAFPIQLWDSALMEDAFLRQVEVPRLALSGSRTKSINADSAVIKGEAFLSNGFHSDGEVQMLNAQIGGSLDCHGGTFNNPGGYALTLGGSKIKGDVFLGDGFHADGEVNLTGAQIDGAVACRGGTFNNPGGAAFLAEDIDVKGSVLLDVDSQKRRFTANGLIDLNGAKIGGDLVLIGGDLAHAGLDLRGASAASIWDDWSDSGRKPNSWPSKGNLGLDGFVYHRIDAGSRNPEIRLKWLELQPEKPFAAQPYLHLAEVLKAHGDDDGATRVYVAMEDRRQSTSDYSGRLEKSAVQAEGLALRWTIGYGYRPLLAFPWILGLTGLSWILYRRSYVAGGIVPSEKDACETYKKLRKVPGHYPKFSPAIYSVENSLPLVKLGQADKWQPDPAPSATQPPLGGWIKRFDRFVTSPRFLRRFLWAQILLGWLLATLFLAGISGVIRKD